MLYASYTSIKKRILKIHFKTKTAWAIKSYRKVHKVYGFLKCPFLAHSHPPRGNHYPNFLSLILLVTKVQINVTKVQVQLYILVPVTVHLYYHIG